MEKKNGKLIDVFNFPFFFSVFNFQFSVFSFFNFQLSVFSVLFPAFNFQFPIP